MAAEKLPAFLEWLALRSDLDSLDGQASAVTMMTVHSAKGLEFPVVFVSGMEEGIFPHHGTEQEDSARIEENGEALHLNGIWSFLTIGKY